MLLPEEFSKNISWSVQVRLVRLVRLGYWCCWIISARLVLSLLKGNRGVRSHKGKSLQGDPFFLRGTSASESEVGGVLEWSI